MDKPKKSDCLFEFLFFYFVLLRWGLALGTSGHIPPVVAAWLPNVVFAGMGLGFLLKLR